MCSSATARAGKTTRVSVDTHGRQGGGDRTNNGSSAPVISANGRYVVFHSADSNLVSSGDTNGVFDIFLHDRRTGRTSRRSASAARRRAGQPGEPRRGEHQLGRPLRASPSTSLASNLGRGEPRTTPSPTSSSAISRPGRRSSPASGQSGNQGDDASSACGVAFSANDRYLVFSSWAANLGWPATRTSFPTRSSATSAAAPRPGHSRFQTVPEGGRWRGSSSSAPRLP